MTRPAWEKPPYHVTSVSLGGFTACTNIGAAYDATNPAKGLGCATVDFTNCTSLLFVVRVNKVGTGTQSWQLWNETDGTELAVLNDAGAAGDRELSTTVAVNLSGLKKIRVRGKSTVAADDPNYFGSHIALS